MKEIENLDWIQEVIAERFDQSIINAMSDNSLIFGGALRDIVAVMPLHGDLDIAVPQTEVTQISILLHRSPKWTKLPKENVARSDKRKSSHLTRRPMPVPSSSGGRITVGVSVTRNRPADRIDVAEVGRNPGEIPRDVAEADRNQDVVEIERNPTGEMPRRPIGSGGLVRRVLAEEAVEEARDEPADPAREGVEVQHYLGDEDQTIGVRVDHEEGYISINPIEEMNITTDETMSETTPPDDAPMTSPANEDDAPAPANEDEGIRWGQVGPGEPAQRGRPGFTYQLPPWANAGPKKSKDYTDKSLNINSVVTYMSSDGVKTQIIAIEDTANPLNEDYKIHGPINSIKKVDIICCGLAMNKKGTVFEVIKGAYEDCRNKVLRFNRSTIETVDIGRLKGRIQKLVERGWESKIDLEGIERGQKRIIEIKQRRKEKENRKKREKVDACTLEKMKRLEKLAKDFGATNEKRPKKKVKMESKYMDTTTYGRY